jgi:DNA polymerase-1
MEKEIDWQTNQQIIQLKRIVSYIGFNNSFYQTGFEADDIIAKIVHSHWEELRNSLSKEPSDDCKPIILTSDADIYQLLNYANIYDPRAEKGITAESFKEDWGIDPEQWWRVKAIAGCSSDKVPGIAGIGEKKAVKYLLGKMNRKTKEYQKIESEESLEIFNRNKKLVKLPLEGVKEFEIQDDIVSIERLIAVFHQYNFMSFLKKNRLEKIIKIFRG